MLKVFIGVKRLKNKLLYGCTIYNNNGLYRSFIKSDVLSKNRYDSHIKSLTWGITKLKMLEEENKVLLFIDSDLLYKWVENEKAPSPYTYLLSQFFLEASFLVNEVEIINNKNNNVLFEEYPKQDELVKITDLI